MRNRKEVNQAYNDGNERQPKPAVCKNDDCNSPANVPGANRGWCVVHYRDWYHNNRQAGICEIDNCNKPANSGNRSMCRTHYIQSLSESDSEICIVDDCNRLANHGKRGEPWGDLCSMHYRRWQLGLPLETPPRYRGSADGKRLPKPEICEFEGCNNPANVPGAARGMCQNHYMQWQRKNYPHKEKSRRRKRKYGISSEQYAEMLEQQNGVCAICGNPPSGYFRGGKPADLVVDHDHSCCTGLGEEKTCGKCVRGLICRACNAKLGWLERYCQDIARYTKGKLRYSGIPYDEPPL